MALTSADFTVTDRFPVKAGMICVTGTYTPSAGGAHSYASGGEVVTKAIAKAAFGLNEIKNWRFNDLLLADFSASRPVAFDHAVSGTTLGKIHVYVAATGVEVVSTTNLNAVSANTARFVLLGK